MIITLTIFISQLLLVFFKHITVRAIAQNKVIKSMIYTMFIQLSWLVSSALGINALLNYDWINVIAYVVGGMVGTVISFRVKV